MVWYDAVILALLVYTAWSGAQRGLVTQLAWIAALILCFKFADKLAPIIEPQINVEQPLKHWIAMFVLYIGFSLGSFMVARIMNSWMEKAKFKDFDRHLGGLLGLVKGVVIALVATFFAVTLSGSLKETVLQSHTGEVACWILDNVEPLTPDYFHEYLAQYRKELAPIHDDHLGEPSSLHDILDRTRNFSPSSGNGETVGQGDGFQIPDFFDGLGGGSGTTRAEDAGFDDFQNAPTFDQMLRTLPANIRENVGDELHTRWNSSSPEEKRNLVDNLTRSFDRKLPSIITDFMARSSAPTTPQGSRAVDPSFAAKLDQIGTIYKDRESIVRRTMEHLTGVPPKVREAVIDDWYADLTMQPSDPDKTTGVETRLDERILNQLDKAGVWQQLSFELKQRLNQSRR